MKRFLKKEWEETPIPSEAYHHARDSAWKRLQGETAPPARPQRTGLRRSPLGYAAAAVAAAVVLLLVLRPDIQLTSSPEQGTPVSQRPEAGGRRPEQRLPQTPASSSSVLLPQNAQRSERKLPKTPASGLRPPASEGAAILATTNQQQRTVGPLSDGRGSDEVASANQQSRDRQEAATAGSAAPSVGPPRVVITFRLPETGVRMIWIKDKNFIQSGGM